MGQWIEVGRVEDIRVLGTRVVKTVRGDIAVFRTADNEIYAMDDRCPHKGGPISQGLVHGKAVACPMHNWNIDLMSGEVLGPDNGCSRVVPVAVKSSIIHLYIEARATGTDG